MSLPGQVLIPGQLLKLARQTSKAPINQEQISFVCLNLSWRAGFLEATEHPADYPIGCQVHNSQGEDMIKGSSIALNSRDR